MFWQTPSLILTNSLSPCHQVIKCRLSHDVKRAVQQRKMRMSVIMIALSESKCDLCDTMDSHVSVSFLKANTDIPYPNTFWKGTMGSGKGLFSIVYSTLSTIFLALTFASISIYFLLCMKLGFTEKKSLFYLPGSHRYRNGFEKVNVQHGNELIDLHWKPNERLGNWDGKQMMMHRMMIASCH